MSLRRSTRVAQPTEHVVVKQNTVKQEIKRSLSSHVTSQVKRVKKDTTVKEEPKPKVLEQEPENWETVYNTLEAYRKLNKAAVDTMGCERLAENSATPVIQRFQTLVSLMLSAQTKDTVTSAAVIKMQKELKGGLCLESILNIEETRLDEMIKTVGFHTKKASYIKRASEILRDQYNGDIPDTIEGLTSLPGVGPKMGYLTLQVAWNKNLGIGVDVHVHRIANRLGWVKTKSPEETRLSLQSWLPKDKWKQINPILVGYGQIVCLPRGPKCDICPVSQYCPSAEKKKVTVKKMATIKKIDKEDNDVKSIYFKNEETLEW